VSRSNFPHRPNSGDPEIVEQIIQDMDTIQGIINGDLQGETNVKVAPPTGVVTGNTNSEGSSDAVSRSDHTHIIRGVEQLSANPTASNFPGRVYFNTTTNQHMVCTETVTPTFVAFSNVAAADVAIHGARHATGGADPLANLGVSSAMLGRSVQTTGLAANVTNVKTSWLTILTMSQIVLPGAQVVTFTGKLLGQNTTGADERLAWQIIDVDNANAFVCGTQGFFVPSGTTGGCPVSDIVNAPIGNHTYRLQATIQGVNSSSNGFDILQTNSVGTPAQPLLSYLSLVVG
jgi:hypothetical protein